MRKIATFFIIIPLSVLLIVVLLVEPLNASPLLLELVRHRVQFLNVLASADERLAHKLAAQVSDEEEDAIEGNWEDRVRRLQVVEQSVVSSLFSGAVGR